MKKFILAVVLAVFGTAAYATESSYVFVVPQKPGSGTSVWAQIVATELEKYLDTNNLPDIYNIALTKSIKLDPPTDEELKAGKNT